MTSSNITVVGAGVVGLWQSLTLARAGHRVRLIESSDKPFTDGASRWAGAMIAPDCEAEVSPRRVRDLGREALRVWRETYPDLVENGTLVVAAARDAGELQRFARVTERHRAVDGDELATLEPELAMRFTKGLFFADEAHLNAVGALDWLLRAARNSGVEVVLATTWNGVADELTIDCRGYAAKNDLKSLRGVRGERILVAAPDVVLSRPIRLLHPRQPIYVVPQGDARYVIGATVIEREDAGLMSVKSALELLGSAYALHPAFSEAEIVDFGAGVRPAFPDNAPKVIAETDRPIIRVNGAYRHGFLLAPFLAQTVEKYLATGERSAEFA